MMVQQSKFLITLFLLMGVFASNAQVDQQQFVNVSGEVATPLRLQISDLLRMERLEVTLKDREGTDHAYTGVPIRAILDSAGVTLGRRLRGENLSKYLLVKCADGYEVLFSLAELDADFGNLTVVLADQMDGKPIADGRGPFRLVVPGDKALARSSFEVISLIVGFAKE